MFVTERLLLRALQPSDKENLLSLFNESMIDQANIDPSFPVPRTVKFSEQFYEGILPETFFCIVEELGSPGIFAGMVAIHTPPNKPNRSGNLSISLLPPYQSKGYGTELMKFVVDYGFKNMGLHRIDLTVAEGNDRAIQLYKDLGFTEEGRRRKYLWGTAGWKDYIPMAMLEEEWKERKFN